MSDDQDTDKYFYQFLEENMKLVSKILQKNKNVDFSLSVWMVGGVEGQSCVLFCNGKPEDDQDCTGDG